MNEAARGRRIDVATRSIEASPRSVYRAFLVPEALVRWLPPTGMTGRIEAFTERRAGAR